MKKLLFVVTLALCAYGCATPKNYRWNCVDQMGRISLGPWQTKKQAQKETDFHNNETPSVVCKCEKKE